MYWCTPPTLTVAIDEKIGWWLVASSYNFVGFAPDLKIGAGGVDVSRSKSNRQTRPSRSPMYATLMKRESAGPVATGSDCRAFLIRLQLFASTQLSPAGELVSSGPPSLPTSLVSIKRPS